MSISSKFIFQNSDFSQRLSILISSISDNAYPSFEYSQIWDITNWTNSSNKLSQPVAIDLIGSGGVETEEKAKTLIDKISSGEKFAKLAKENSKDKGSAEKGGDLGYFGRGKMVPEFERATLGLKVGELSSPVKTRFGFHVIKLTAIKEGDPANFEQAAVKTRLLAEAGQEIETIDTARAVAIDPALGILAPEACFRFSEAYEAVAL